MRAGSWQKTGRRCSGLNWLVCHECPHNAARPHNWGLAWSTRHRVGIFSAWLVGWSRGRSRSLSRGGGGLFCRSRRSFGCSGRGGFLNHFLGQFLGCVCCSRGSGSSGCFSRSWRRGSHWFLHGGCGFFHRCSGSRFGRSSRGCLGGFCGSRRGFGRSGRGGHNLSSRRGRRSSRSRRGRRRSGGKYGTQAFYLCFRGFFQLWHKHKRGWLGQNNGNGRAKHQ